jgi:hemolysin D
LALAWACLSKVDIIASAPGKIIPSGRTKVIPPFEDGRRASNPCPRRAERQGRASPDRARSDHERAERNHLRSDLTSAQLDVARLRAALSGNDDPLTEFHPPAAAPPNLVAMQRQFLVSQMSEYAAKLAALDRQRAQKDAERATIATTVAKLDATIPILQERVNIRKGLADKELVSKIIYLETLHQLVDQQQDHKVQESLYREANRLWRLSLRPARRPRRSSAGRYGATEWRPSARRQISAKTW